MEKPFFIPGHGDDSLEDDTADLPSDELQGLYAVPLYTHDHEFLDNPYMVEKLMGTYPVLMKLIIDKYREPKNINMNVSFTDLPDNSSIAGKDKINFKKSELLEIAGLLYQFTGKPIIQFVCDDCITNKLLANVLKNIFGDQYSTYVNEINIDYDIPPEQQSFEVELRDSNHSLIIIGGSESDTYNMDLGHFTSGLAEIIQNTGSDYAKEKINNRILGICFGHQYVCKLLAEQNKESPSIGVTNRHIWHCGLSSINISLDRYIPEIYKSALGGLTNERQNSQISAIFTRGSAFHDDLLGAGENNTFIPLAYEPFTGLNVIHGVKNGKVLTAQPHFEIPMTKKQNDILEWVQLASVALSQKMLLKMNLKKIVENFGYTDEGNKYVKKDLDEAFYVYSILAFIRDIYSELIKTQSPPKEAEEYNPTITSLRAFTRWRVDGLLPENQKFDSKKSIESFIAQVDKTGRLRINTSFDWKVDRGIIEGSKILGLKDLSEFIKFLRVYHNNSTRAFLVLDIGAGDGTLLSELYKNLGGYEIVEYGAGDFLYLDLYHILKNSEHLKDIQNKVKIIFVNKVLQNLKDLNNSSLSVKDQLKIATKNLNFLPTDKVSHGSMFSEETNMFPGEELECLGRDGMEYLNQHKDDIKELITSCQNSFYSHCNKFSDRIYISSFSDLRTMPNNMFRFPDFQYSIRSTSHIDGPEYTNFIYESIHERMKEGGILLDNGVHRSYTSIPRIPELYEVFTNTKVPIKMRLLFDTNSNYFTSVLVERFPFIEDDSIITKNLSDGVILIDIEEVYKTTFFKVEHFLRNMIIANYKLKNVFWDFNREIVSCIKEIITILGAGENKTQKITDKIIHLLQKITEQKKLYEKNIHSINANIIGNYRLDGVGLDDILQDFYHPDWINPNGKRYY